jgi:hypothetical protein
VKLQLPCEEAAAWLHQGVFPMTCEEYRPLNSQHHQDTQLFVSLFKEFNARYDKLNEKLNAIVRSESEFLTEQDQQVLFDYFNLCAEHYLFYKAGYIDEEVWQSWLAGMKYFARKEAVRSFWEADLKFNSYYSFTLELFEPTSAAWKICD